MTVTVTAGETSTADLSAYLPLLAWVRNGARPQADWSAIVDDAVHVWARRSGSICGRTYTSSPPITAATSNRQTDTTTRRMQRGRRESRRGNVRH